MSKRVDENIAEAKRAAIMGAKSTPYGKRTKPVDEPSWEAYRRNWKVADLPSTTVAASKKPPTQSDTSSSSSSSRTLTKRQAKRKKKLIKKLSKRMKQKKSNRRAGIKT